MFGGMIRDGIRDGSLRTSDVHVATYAILLQCTGVALWFDPDGPLGARARSPSSTSSSCSARCRRLAELIAEAIEQRLAGARPRRGELS